MNEKRYGRALRMVVSSLAAPLALAAFVTEARAEVTAQEVTFDGPDNVELSGVLYLPDGFEEGSDYSAVVMLHGCSGMWSNRNPNATNGDGSPNLQNNVEKWGWKLADEGVVALAVDSFTPRTPLGVSDSDWQNQCSGATYAGYVNPYSTRALDARAAWDYLDAHPLIDGASIALLGWSHGAQAAMVEAAETPPNSTTPRAASDMLFAATVLFYPGCGSALGFSSPSSSYWRPYNDLRLNIGDDDSFYANCQTRANRAINNYGSTPGSGHEVIFAGYVDAAHSFDTVSQAWPASTCGAPNIGDTCAMQAADIDSLSFLLSRI
jgi:dienelactone hydrolase